MWNILIRRIISGFIIIFLEKIGYNIYACLYQTSMNFLYELLPPQGFGPEAFLEISTHLFLPYLSNLRIRNEFTDLLFNVCSHYMSSREHSSLLSKIREPVWLYIINLCSSFTARDCNACFSQIFEKRAFGYLNEEEESLFMTLRTFNSFCSSCSNFVNLNSSIFNNSSYSIWIVILELQ